jgi:hypothetical protein
VGTYQYFPDQPIPFWDCGTPHIVSVVHTNSDPNK